MIPTDGNLPPRGFYWEFPDHSVKATDQTVQRHHLGVSTIAPYSPSATGQLGQLAARWRDEPLTAHPRQGDQGLSKLSFMGTLCAQAGPAKRHPNKEME